MPWPSHNRLPTYMARLASVPAAVVYLNTTAAATVPHFRLTSLASVLFASSSPPSHRSFHPPSPILGATPAWCLFFPHTANTTPEPRHPYTTLYLPLSSKTTPFFNHHTWAKFSLHPANNTPSRAALYVTRIMCPLPHQPFYIHTPAPPRTTLFCHMGHVPLPHHPFYFRPPTPPRTTPAPTRSVTWAMCLPPHHP